jgi:hypothetical protein
VVVEVAGSVVLVPGCELVPVVVVPPVPKPDRPTRLAPVAPDRDRAAVTSPVSELAPGGRPRPAACEAPGKGTASADAAGAGPEAGNCSEFRGGCST